MPDTPDTPELPDWDQVASTFQQRYPDMDQDELRREWQQRQITSNAAQRAQGEPQDSAEYFARRSIPFGSAFLNLTAASAESRIRQRMQEGTARNSDIELLTQFEADRQRQASQGTAGQIASGLASLPAVVGEAQAGGAILGGAARAIPGLGWLAPAAAEAAPSIFSRAGVAVAGRAVASPSAWGRNALQTATMPSLWAEGWAERNREEGRDALDIRGLPAAYAQGFLTNAVLGSTRGLGAPSQQGVFGAARNVLTRTAAGMVEQAGVDVMASAISEVLPKAWKLQTGYGLVGDIVRGARTGNFEPALTHAVTQAVTFAAFSVMHGLQEPHEAIEQMRDAFDAAKEESGPQLQPAQHINDYYNRQWQEAERQVAPERPGGPPERPAAPEAPTVAPTPPEAVAGQPGAISGVTQPESVTPGPEIGPTQPAHAEPIGPRLPETPNGVLAEAVQAFRAMGDSAKEARAKVDAVTADRSFSTVEELLRAATARPEAARPPEVPPPPPPEPAFTPKQAEIPTPPTSPFRPAAPEAEHRTPVTPAPPGETPPERVRRIGAENGLTERESNVVLDRAHGRSLQDIGTDLGLTRERVRQIEADARKKLGIEGSIADAIHKGMNAPEMGAHSDVVIPEEMSAEGRATVSAMGRRGIPKQVAERISRQDALQTKLERLYKEFAKEKKRGTLSPDQIERYQQRFRAIDAQIAHETAPAPAHLRPEGGGDVSPGVGTPPVQRGAEGLPVVGPAGAGQGSAAPQGHSEAAPAAAVRGEAAGNGVKQSWDRELTAHEWHSIETPSVDKSGLDRFKDGGFIELASPLRDGTTKAVEVHLDPSVRTLAKLVKASGDLGMKGLLTPEGAIVWPAEYGYHEDVEKRLGVNGTRVVISKPWGEKTLHIKSFTSDAIDPRDPWISSLAPHDTGYGNSLRVDPESPHLTPAEKANVQALSGEVPTHEDVRSAAADVAPQADKDGRALADKLQAEAERASAAGELGPSPGPQQGPPGPPEPIPAPSAASVTGEPGDRFPGEPQPPVVPGTVGGTHGQGPGRGVSTGGKETAIAHEVREEANPRLAAIEKQTAQSFPEVWHKAREASNADPQAVVDLARSIVEKGGKQGVTAEQEAMLAHRLIAVENEMSQRTVTATSGKMRDFSEREGRQWNRRAGELAEQHLILDRAIHLVGSETGRTLAFRRQIIRYNYELGNLIGRATAADPTTPLTPEHEKALQNASEKIKALEDQIDSMEKNLGKGGMLHPTPENFDRLNDLRIESNRTKKSAEDIIASRSWKTKSTTDKAWDWMKWWRVNSLISGPSTYGKLFASSLARSIEPTFDNLIGTATRVIPGLREVAAKADIHGQAIDPAIEFAALKYAKENVAEAVKDYMTRGRSKLDDLYAPAAQGEPPHTLLDSIGNSHAAVKALATLTAFQRTKLLLEKDARRQGKEMTTALESEIGQRAYQEHQRAKFQADYGFTKWADSFITQGKTNPDAGVRIAANVADNLFPIRKIPVNIVLETLGERLLGFPIAATKVGLFHAGKGRTLTTDQANLIMRQFNKGVPGLGALALGLYIGGKTLGGLYSGRRREDDLQPGEVDIGLTKIPNWVTSHQPLAMMAHLGAAISREADKVEVHHGVGERVGAPAATARSMGALLQEVPYFHEQRDLGQVFRGDLGPVARSYAIPALLRQVAARTDQREPFSAATAVNPFAPAGAFNRRVPHGVVENVQSVIPGLRQQVPTR